MTLIEKCHLYFIYEVEFDRLRDFGIERHEIRLRKVNVYDL